MKEYIDPPKKRSKAEIEALTEKYRISKTKIFDIVHSDSSRSGGKRRTISSGLSEYSGPWGADQVKHLLRRTLFGIRKTEVQDFLQLNASSAVDTLLQTETFPGPPINNYNEFADEPDPNVPDGETWILSPYSNSHEGLKIYSLKAWIVDQMLNQGTSIHQKLILFWHNLLPTQMWGVFQAKTSYKYWKMLFDNSFGNYKDLIKQLTIDPCMLFYLNGTYNHKNAPDENYARELQELFCIGKGPNSGYTEADVQAAARVLTGWVIIGDSVYGEGEPISVFADAVLQDPNDYWHDESDKQFSAFYGNRVIQGRSGANGAQELDDMLDMIFDNDETALYICRRLYNFFVYHEIDTTTETNVIQPLAQIFRDNNYEIMPVLSALLKSEHFFDSANHGAYIKNPADNLIGMLRNLEVPTKGLHDGTPAEKILRNVYLNFNMGDRGMEIGDPPSVAGWQAYYQEPTYDKIWLSADTLLSRIRTQDYFIWGNNIYGIDFPEFSLIDFVEGLDTPDDPSALVEEATDLLLGVALAADKKEGLVNILDPIGTQWGLEWNDYVADPDNEMKKSVVESRLRSLFQAMLQFGEFQLM